MSNVRERVFTRLRKELLDDGWSEVPGREANILYHPEHGCHDIFKAAFIQRDSELLRNRKMVLKAFAILSAIVLLGNAAGYVLSLLGVH